MSGRKVLVVGACGRMGEQVRKWVDAHPSLSLGAALEASDHPAMGETIAPGVTLCSDIDDVIGDADVVIDFTVPDATVKNLQSAARAGVAYVTGTTGLSEEQKAEIHRLSNETPIIHAPNFSLSVNVLGWLAREAARKLGSEFDAELFEIHHSAKRDAPSGTALFLAEAVAEGRDQSLHDHVILERAGETGPRPEAAIGIQTLRGGDNPGEHTLYFVGTGERVELTHRSATRDHFAKGAVQCADWLIGKAPGLYPIETVYGLE
ncbi:MAG: 4-hydroxy-tetrahydrodipicolinate reductase [Myxococcota bacterium]